MGTPEVDYDELGAQAIIRLLRKEHAAVWLEIETKLSEPSDPRITPRKGINPHHLTNARHNLINDGLIEQIPHLTKGGRTIDVFGLKDRYKRTTVFDKAAARKSLLQARYLGWASGSPNLIGSAGERVTRVSLLASKKGGYRPISPNFGSVKQLFGQRVPIGSMDSGAYFTVLDDIHRPMASTVLVEIKNIREWIYPSSSELHQLLSKTALLQIANPTQLFIPVLVCRRAHLTSFRMAKDLGFLIFETRVQPILPTYDVDTNHLEQVRTELGYDLLLTEDTLPKLTRDFDEIIPAYAFRTTSRWRRSAPALSEYYQNLRRDGLPGEKRDLLRQAIRSEAGKIFGDLEGGW